MKAFLKENHNSRFGTKLEFALNDNKIVDKNFSWEEENEEFRFHNELYDVVRIEKKYGKIELICIKDNDENQLEKQVNEIRKNQQSKTQKNLQNNIKFFSLFYVENNPRVFVPVIDKIENGAAQSVKLLSSYIDMQIPPPRC